MSMGAPYDEVAVGLYRINTLLSWWGAPGTDGNYGIDRQHEIDTQMARFLRSISHLQQACREAYCRHLETALSANHRLAHTVQGLARGQGAQELITAESDVVAILLEAALLQAQAWIGLTRLTQKLQESAMAMARETDDDVRQQTPEQRPQTSE